jgi:hypothetical protein
VVLLIPATPSALKGWHGLVPFIPATPLALKVSSNHRVKVIPVATSIIFSILLITRGSQDLKSLQVQADLGDQPQMEI